MPSVTVEVEVYCTCGAGLCNQTESTQTHRRGEPAFIVAPCDSCLDKARADGRTDGYDEAIAEQEAQQ